MSNPVNYAETIQKVNLHRGSVIGLTEFLEPAVLMTLEYKYAAYCNTRYHGCRFMETLYTVD